MNAHEKALEVAELVRQIRPLLLGKDPDVQGAALADLLAMWLAGHVMRGDPKMTKKLREMMLKAHIVAVRGLIPLNYKIHVEPQLKERTQ